MAIRTELSLRLPNTPGALSQVCDALVGARVNLVGLHLEGSGRLRIIVDNPLSGAGALREREYQVDEREVLYAVVPNAPGALAGMARLVADGGVNIDYAYATALEGGAMSAIVLGVADAQRAATAAGL
jgi:hypothetical protein